jgi:hypothetical protein
MVPSAGGEKDLFILFDDGDRTQGGLLAGPGYADALVRFKHRTMSRAHQAALLVGQKFVRRPVQRATLVRAGIQPGAWLAVVTCGHQPAGLPVDAGLQLAVLAFLQSLGAAQELGAIQGVFLYMNNQWQRFYQPPSSPLARLGLVLLGIGILALSFVLGLFFLAIAVGLAVIGGIVLSVRRWLGLGRPSKPDDGMIDAEYRVIYREKSRRDD